MPFQLAINLGDYGFYTGIVLITIGAIVFIVGIVLTLTKRWKRTHNDDEDILTN